MPTEGCTLWSDNMVIPVGAANTPAALAWMDFAYDPAVQAAISAYVAVRDPGRGSPGGSPESDPESASNQLIFPDEQFIENCVDAAGSTRRPGGVRGGQRGVPGCGHRLTGAIEGQAAADVMLMGRPRDRPPPPRSLLAARPGGDLAGAVLRHPHVLHGGAGAPHRHLHRGLPAGLRARNFSDALSGNTEQLVRSFWYAGVATLIALLIAYPLAYAIALRAGRWKLLLLFAVIAPFFTTYLIRTIAWKTILADASPIVDVMQSLALRPRRRPGAGDRRRRDRRAHLQLPAVHDPADLRQPRADGHEPDRGGQGPLRLRDPDLPAGDAADQRARIVAGVLLTFICCLKFPVPSRPAYGGSMRRCRQWEGRQHVLPAMVISSGGGPGQFLHQLRIAKDWSS